MAPRLKWKTIPKRGSKGKENGHDFGEVFARILGRFRGLSGLLELAPMEGPKMTFRSLILCLLGVAVGLPAQATPLPRYGLFVFSSLCTDHVTSDLNGDRLVLVRLALHDVGYLEWSDGSLSSAPLQALKIDDKSGRISFRYLRDYDDASGKSNVLKSVASTISAESVGLMSWDGKPFRLKRLENLGQKLPICHK